MDNMVEAYSLYIHIPFCAQKCNYCDFNSIVSEDKLIVRYVQALQEEIKLIADKYAPEIKTIYIGGGTPTILSGAQLVDVLEECRQQFELEAGLEVTIEANPGTVNQQQLKLIKQAGVNRLSFGVQSFNNDFLNQLGRIHTAQDVKDSYYLARKVGFDNISFDLMSALPGQSLEDWQNTLTEAIELGPEHLSTYNLKIESGTVFKQWLEEGKIEKVDEGLDLEMYRMSIDLLEKNNYQQYEISNFSQPQYKSARNKTRLGLL
jgi:oxygen-independent coproporphyrinogen-3 oxidase